MIINNYIQAIIETNSFQEEDTHQLKSLTEKYPYFQLARALYLKTLKNNESFKYNNELKITAAYTTDREVLFDLITSEDFQQKEKTEEKKPPILKSLVLSKVKNSQLDKAIEELSIGKPLSFTKSEAFSFNQWLELSSKKVIIRDISEENEPKKSEQEEIIDRFIENNPKISRPVKGNNSDVKAPETQQNNQLMTETLAKVYLEQKKYDSAIQAYKILSLKYPEKSGFFADQVKRIKILQNNK
ncbi:hypothetical protein ACQY1Q_08595 [Tenacibaculum sp. TC6]|uniref:hypothetical protein n=1 Tax=Tenacibaculum sp. TC6 TaxID=3423223 RepID=UPI003D35FD33